MIETFAPDRADEPFGEGVLPRAVGRGQHFMDPHALHSVLERVTVYAVAIAEEIERRAVLRERVDELLGGPGGGGMLGDVEVEGHGGGSGRARPRRKGHGAGHWARRRNRSRPSRGHGSLETFATSATAASAASASAGRRCARP